MGDDEVVIFVDAVHPTHAARPVGCWAPKEQKLAIEQTSGRERINIHGAIDLETGQTRMIEAETIDATSTIRLLESLEALYPLLVCIHVFLDNARYHHAKLVKEWLARPGCRIKLRMSEAHQMPLMRGELPNDLPPYCPLMSQSNDEFDRAVLRPHAQECRAQQMLRHMRTIRGRHARFLARQSSQEVEPLPQLRHR